MAPADPQDVDAHRRAVEAVLVRYATGIDTRDWAKLRTCFADDVRADYGDIGRWGSADALVGFMEAAHAGFVATNHLITNVVVELDGDRAAARCYVHAVLVTGDDASTWLDTVGRYDDTLVRADGGWRIDTRTFTPTRMTSGDARSR